ncbi:MAG: OmpA family protein [Deltaproteobacteria bacterium]|nr:OmpA family protein [Deltaproteobacteria bacterium]
MGSRRRPVMSRTLLAVFLVTSLVGCADMVVQQTGFSPLLVQASPPPPPEPKVEKIDIPEKIQFDFGKATLKKVSFKILDHVVKVMTERPGVKKVQIEGHTDAVGDAERNRVLSQRRAEAVMEYLVKKGIAATRLGARGFGPDKPIAPNETEVGREANRRVEFIIVEQDGK